MRYDPHQNAFARVQYLLDERREAANVKFRDEYMGKRREALVKKYNGKKVTLKVAMNGFYPSVKMDPDWGTLLQKELSELDDAARKAWEGSKERQKFNEYAEQLVELSILGELKDKAVAEKLANLMKQLNAMEEK